MKELKAKNPISLEESQSNPKKNKKKETIKGSQNNINIKKLSSKLKEPKTK